MITRIAVCCLFLLSSLYSTAQFVNFGQDRASLKWKQIRTENFQLIYPDFFEENAQKIANIYARLYRHANSLQIKAKKISMILHADGGISNGNVALAPRKSELYTMPSQDPSDAWLEHLCVHEFRHVQQFDKINQHFTKACSYIFGDLAPIAVVGLCLPMWFIEGDAVCFETSVGNLGRGRSPEFLDEMKAQIVDKGLYSFNKAVLGSYKDFVPNRYNFGYIMTANTRKHYGTHIWSEALANTARHPYRIFPFNQQLRKTIRSKRDSVWQTPDFCQLTNHTDSLKRANYRRNSLHTLYLDNFSELQAIWKQEALQRPNHFDTIRTSNSCYTNYYYPTLVKRDSLICYKEGIQETGSFVLLHNGQENRITRTGTLVDYKFAANSRYIVWSEYLSHPRWHQGGRMRLSIYDMHNKTYRQHQGKNNQFAPFRVGNKWGFVETDRQNRSYIVICDSTLQKELWRFSATPDEHFIHPSYHNGFITVVVQTKQGNRLERINIESRSRQSLTPTVPYEIDNPITLTDSMVIYRASYDTHNCLYSLVNGKTSRILSGRYGLRFPTYQTNDKQLYFSFYTADGYKPAKATLEKCTSEPVRYSSFTLADKIKEQENWYSSNHEDSIKFPSKKYRKFPNLLNIHSWAPVYASLSPMKFDLGATIYSQNKLSTLTFSAGFIKQSSRQYGNWLFDATYSGWWPIIGLKIESGREDTQNLTEARNLQTDTVSLLYINNKSRLTSTDVIVQFPFNLSKKQFSRSINPYFRYQIQSLHHFQPLQVYNCLIKGQNIWLTYAEKDLYDIRQTPKNYQFLEYGLIFNNQTRQTEQESNPRWGQYITGGYTHTLNTSAIKGNQWWADAIFYFPGISQNHSLSLYGGFQHMSHRTRTFTNKISSPRGTYLYGYELTSLRSSYLFPLCFPDWHISSLAYFKSLYACLFYDYGFCKNLTGTQHCSSYGIELTTDSHFLRLTYPIHMGIRTGYQTQSKKPFAEFLFSIGLSI